MVRVFESKRSSKYCGKVAIPLFKYRGKKKSPIATNATPEGQAKNRRVEIGVSANEEMIQDAKAQAN